MIIACFVNLLNYMYFLLINMSSKPILPFHDKTWRLFSQDMIHISQELKSIIDLFETTFLQNDYKENDTVWNRYLAIMIRASSRLARIMMYTY